MILSPYSPLLSTAVVALELALELGKNLKKNINLHLDSETDKVWQAVP